MVAKKIKDHVIKDLGKTISLNDIRWYLKQELNQNIKNCDQDQLTLIN